MQIIIKNSGDSPIYRQIADQIKEQILQGDLEMGDQLPSIRSLASDLKVSVITTKKAYDVLEEEGFINSIQGKGSFVSSGNREILREKSLKRIEDKMREVIREAKITGINGDDLKKIIDLLWEE